MTMRSDHVRTVPANEASYDDLQTIFSAGDGHRCQCQYFKMSNKEWRSPVRPQERAEALREQTGCGNPNSASTSGLVAYCEGDPAGWCAVEPRTAYPRLAAMRVPWSGRKENKTDDGIWAVTCFVVRKEYRRRGIAAALAEAAVAFARQRGARAVEGYPRITQPGEKLDAAALYVGTGTLFAAAGFREVSRPTPRRAVMRVDL